MNGKKTIKESTQEYARGITGGLLFSFPVLYTMEVWWAGYRTQPFGLIIIIFVTFLLLLAYNRYAGMRPGVAWKGVAIDSVEEMGIGLFVSFVMLLMLDKIELSVLSIDEILGKVIVEAMFVSIGVSIGTAQLGESTEEEEDIAPSLAKERESGIKRRSGKMAVAALALCGSILIGGNVAPTDEVVDIALKAQPHNVLIMVIVSILLCVLVTYFSDFKGSGRKKMKNLTYHMTFDTCLSYMIALIASAFVLWYFGRFEGLCFENIVAECVVLGVIASLGASAGRLLIK